MTGRAAPSGALVPHSLAPRPHYEVPVQNLGRQCSPCFCSAPGYWKPVAMKRTQDCSQEAVPAGLPSASSVTHGKELAPGAPGPHL